MARISINKPCHENWAEMTPTQQGAFCQKCAVDVVDFSEKSPQQVKEILLAKRNDHICGRFSKNQLVGLNEVYENWTDQSVPVFRSKFLWACLIAFGMTLFAGCAMEPVNAMNTFSTNSIGLINAVNEPADSTKIPADTVDTIKPTDFEEYRKGKISISEPIEEPEDMIMGDVAIDAPELDSSVFKKSPVIETYAIVKGINAPLNTFGYNLGDTTLNPDQATVQNSTLGEEFIVELFPNPSNGPFKIALDSEIQGAFSIRVFVLSGQIIQELEKGIIRAGERRIIDINISLFPAGIYIIEIQLNNKRKRLKMEKVD